MKIAMAQLNYTIGDFEINKMKIINAVYEAKAQKADLVVFGEQAISGAPGYDLLNKVSFLDMCEQSLIEIASHCDNISVIIGLPTQGERNKTISVAAYIEDRKVKRYIGKKHIVSRDELFHLSPSKGYEFINVKGTKVAVVLGKDLLYGHEFGDQADVIVNISNSHYMRGVIEIRYDLLQKLSYQTGKPIFYLNNIGGQTDVIYDGSSVALNGKGEVITFLKNFEEDFVTIDLEQENLPISVPYQNKTVNVYRAIKLGLKDYLEKNDKKTAVIALSGGIDSAVVTALTTEVLGPENVKVLLMPSQFSSTHSVEAAKQLAEKLGIEYHIVPICSTFKEYTKILGPVFGELPFDKTEENIQARIRATVLAAYANKFNHTILNTSNKSELAVGNITLHGDSIGSLSPLGDVYKTEVYDLARYINRNEVIIPPATITKEASAELRPDQKDTDELPPYDLLDAILYRMFEEGQSREEIMNAGFEADDVYKVYQMVIQSEYKRHEMCPILRLSTCTLGQNRILPLTNHYGY